VRVFLDTNVLIASVLDLHDAHVRCLPLLGRVQDGKDEGFISAHSLAEMYAVLTKIPPPLRHSPEQALLSIEENILNHFNVLHLRGTEYGALIRDAAAAGIQGGTIYDTVLLRSATKANPDRIYTLNLKHFQAVAPAELVSALISP
jgi:predicted nucleic acid-binding protein